MLVANVFLSYSRADQPRVAQLVAKLEETGYSIWWDRHIDGGAEFSADIERELHVAETVIVAWSKDSTASRWVRDEAGVALEADKLIAITLDGTAPPLGFKQLHAIDMQRADGLDDLKRSLANKLGGDLAPAPQSFAPTSKRRPKAALIAAPLLAAVVGFGFWAWESSLSREQTEAAESENSKSLAILPFRDLSPGQDQQWFTDGLAEEITSTLARAPDLKVAPRAAAFQYRGSEIAPAHIASALGVVHILDGSVRRDGEGMRVSVELIRASDGSRIWSQDYDRTTEAAIEVQEEIATEVARILETAMDPEALAAMVDTGTRSIEAYEAFLKSAEANKTISNSLASIERAEQAYTIDPNFARAYLRAARNRLERTGAFYFAYMGPEDAVAQLPVFEREVNLALSISKDPVDRDFARALQARGRYRLKEARDYLVKVVEARPSDTDALSLLADMELMIGNFSVARQRLAELADAFPQGISLAINGFTFAGDLDAAVSYGEQMLLEQPDSDAALYQMHRALMWKGDAKRGAQILERLRRFGLHPYTIALAELRQACLEGRLKDARRHLASSIESDGLPVQALLVAGYRKQAYDLLIDLDRPTPPILLAEVAVHSNIDSTHFPNLSRLLREQGIEPRKAKPMPYACPVVEE